jgi:hypothetical protein
MAKQKIEVPLSESKSREDYKVKLFEAVGYYFNRPYACDLPIERGETIFTHLGREFDVLDYRRWIMEKEHNEHKKMR